MRIAISASGLSLDAEVDPRFGRCQHFIIADPETMEFEAVDNSSATSASGAGISAAQMIAGKGVQAVLTGSCGPNAYQVLSSAGIQIITGVSGIVKDVIEGYRTGKLQPSAQANVPDHSGMGATPGMGGGFGMGRGMGMGRGRGRGMGRGMGIGRGMGFSMTPPTSPTPQPQSPEQELETLKAQSQALAQQLADIKRRIEEIEKKAK
jgi:predicted Fe-Mo cluster-binding NifX family protein